MDILKETTPTSILKLDNFGIQQKNSFGSFSPKVQSPADRSSVTFAEELRKNDETIPHSFFKSMDNIHNFTSEMNGGDSDEENYSTSLNAIIQRKASSRRSKKHKSRRTSSPFSADILPGIEVSRRTSVFTTSSGDTAITMDESFTQELTKEKIFENIKLHKEVLNNVKMQPWNMRKKIKLVMQAKNYVKKHEGELQERFTKTHSIKNILARWNIYFIKNLHHYKREIANISNWMIPWERRIKEIESHFGSVVASYFIFLRWLFWVNFVTAEVLIAFIVIPEIVIATTSSNTERKLILPEDKYNSTNLLTLWDFDGALKYTPLFYGWYTNKDDGLGYRLPLAFFMTQLLVYVYSFVATLRKMAENSRLSKLSEKGDECIFSWKLFTGWDYMIGNAETASNRVMSIVMSFKEALLEEAERKRRERNWKIIWIRVFVNITILCLFALSAAAVVFIVKRSTEPEGNTTLWRRNETAVVMSLISFLFPMILELLGFMERYHPRKQLRIQLGRIMLLNLLNIFSLVFAQFDKINGMTIELLQFKKNTSLVSPENTIANITILQPLELTTNIIDCKHTCYTSVLQNDLNVTHLITFIITSIQMVTLPIFLNNIMRHLPINNTENISNVPNYNELITFNNNSQPPNISVYTEYCTEFPNLNVSAELMKYCNKTINENIDYIKDHPQDTTAFQDYLHYILENVILQNDSSISNESDFLHNTITNYNLTSSFENFYLDYLKSTVLPISTKVARDVEESLEERITNFFHNVSNIVNLIKITYPDYLLLEMCKNKCVDEVMNKKNVENYSFHTTFTSNSNSLNLETNNWNYQNLTKLRSLCWETMFGQEIVKLTVMDFIFTVVGSIFMDFIRGVFVRIMNKCWCWDLEKKFPEYAEFKVAENILHLVNNQGMVWMGMFFSPGIVLINVMKLMFLMYIRSWVVLTCNVPHSVIFRASRSNNFYFALLLTMLFLCVLPVGYAIVWVDPSWHCGPFSEHQRIFHILTKTVRLLIPLKLQKLLDYIVSPGIVIPLLILLILIIYYLISLTNSLREANTDLKLQLRQERTEERRKMFQVANRRRRGGSGNMEDLDNTPFNKWKKLLGTVPSIKSTDEPPKDIIVKSRATKQETKNDAEQPNSLADKGFRKGITSSDGNEIQITLEMAKPNFPNNSEIEISTGKRVKIIDIAKSVANSNVFQQKLQTNYDKDFLNSKKVIDSFIANNHDTVPAIEINKSQSSESIIDHLNDENDKTSNDFNNSPI